MSKQNASYQEFADMVQAELQTSTQFWEPQYARYAQELTRKKHQISIARKSFRVLEPLSCYITIGEVTAGSQTAFDLRFLGQSVGSVVVKANGRRVLRVSKEKAGNSKKYFQYPLGAIADDDWSSGRLAQQFRSFYRTLSGQQNIFPRQREHMVESALFSELEKTCGTEKTLNFIQPVTYIAHTRFHMKTALAASRAPADTAHCSASGGEIDIFCRFRHGNRSRLTVIEVKDENNSGETFSLAIKQAITYAVFIRELARSESGPLWMNLWGMGNQPWAGGFTINAVAAMPKGSTTDFSFTKQTIHLGQDHIELHYMAFSENEKPCNSTEVRFETSLSSC